MSEIPITTDVTPKIPQPRSGGSPIQQDELSRLLPSGMSENINSAAQREGGSPPMDQDAWMAQMMGNLWVNAQGGVGAPGQGAAPPPPPPQQPMPHHHQQGHQHPGRHQAHQQQQHQQGGYTPTPRGGGGHFGGSWAPPPHNGAGEMPQPGGGGRGGGFNAYNGGGEYRGGGGGYGRGGRGGRGGYRGRGGRGGGETGGGGGGYGAADQPQQNTWQTRHALAVVEFKRERLKKFPCPLGIPPGAYVIVDGDRGQDCGLVVQMITNTEKGMDVQTLDGTELDGSKLRLESGRVLRAATESEVNILHQEIAQLERAALKTCRAKCKELGFSFELIDCEYQFDRKKISFFFNATESIDFRELVKDLYKTFGARIWMENINPEVKNTVPAGALSRHEKVALSKYPDEAAAAAGDASVGAEPFYPNSGRRRVGPDGSLQ